MLEINLCVPEGKLRSLQASSIQLPGYLGEMGIGLNHAAFVSKLRHGIVASQGLGDETNLFFVARGICSVADNVVDVLAPYIEDPEHIDLDRAKASGSRARKRLEGVESGVDMMRAFRSLERAKLREKLVQLQKKVV